MILWGLLACPAVDKPSCGNGVLDAGEVCEPALSSGGSCSELGANWVGGDYECASDCTIFTAACEAGEPSLQPDTTCAVDGFDPLGVPRTLADPTCDDPGEAAQFGVDGVWRVRVRGRGPKRVDFDALIAEAQPFFDGIELVVDGYETSDGGDVDRVGFAEAAVAEEASDALPIWVVDTFGVGCGESTAVGPTAEHRNPLVVVAEDCGGPALAHQLGHAFGLWHPHRPQDAGCKLDGDLLCDTPIDPGPAGAWPEGPGTCSGGSPPSCEVTCEGDQQPDPRDPMSLYTCGDSPENGSLFTDQQRQRMRCTLARTGSAWLLPCTDEDGDGRGADGGALCPQVGQDCDDSDDRVHPGAEERCNGQDDDCDGVADEGC